VFEELKVDGKYDMIRGAILTCAQKPTRVSLIYRTEPTTKKWKTEKPKSKNGRRKPFARTDGRPDNAKT